MSWTIDIDLPDQVEQNNSQQDQQQHNNSPSEAEPSDNESNAERQQPNKIVIPSAKKIRKATLNGIKIGVLPEYQDYCVVLQYLVNQFIKNDFSFAVVQERVPWLNQWLMNPFNENLLNEELELAAKLEASRIQRQIQFMLQGGLCTRTCGRVFGCLCCCVPCLAIICKVCAYFTDLCISCCWASLFDWWLGKFCRKYILAYLCYLPKWIKMKIEDLLIGDAMFDDEELTIRNIYDSNSYKIANQYACILFLAIVLTMLGGCIVIVSYIYLPKHPDQTFVRAESVIGIVLLTSGCFGLQFYCRCTL